jgi:bacteriocin-like protein
MALRFASVMAITASAHRTQAASRPDDADDPVVEQQEAEMDTQEYEIELLSDDELNSVVGGAMNDFTNYTKWANDPSPDKLPWNPAFPPGRPR